MEVSIIIPFNRDRGYLAEAIASAKSQTIPVDVIEAFSPGTCAQNLAAGLAMVKTPFYCVLAEDDWLERDFCEKMLEGIKSAKCSAVCSNAVQHGITPTFYQSRPPSSLKALLSHNSIHGGTVIYNTDIVRHIGGYDDTLTTAEELELHYRLLKNDMCISYINYTGYHYRRHGQQKSMVKQAARQARIDAIKKIREKYS